MTEYRSEKTGIDQEVVEVKEQIPSDKESINIEPNQAKIMDDIDQKISSISDLDKEFLDQVSEAACDFSNNPRDIKRFINLFRFYRFLMTTIDKTQAPSFAQIRRWTILCLKWPQVVRWLYFTDTGTGYDTNPYQVTIITHERLARLEKLGQESQDQDQWRNNLKKELDLDSDDNTVSWINDKNLFEFFKREGTEYIDEPISKGAGLGLY